LTHLHSRRSSLHTLWNTRSWTNTRELAHFDGIVRESKMNRK
jgi:hypothetical protein